MFRHTFTRTYSSYRIGVLGVPFSKGQTKNGVDKCPEYLRKAGFVDNIRNIHERMDVTDYGDIAYEVDGELKTIPNMKGYADVVACNLEVSKNVEKILNDGRMCLTIGGDHSIGIGTVDGHLKGKSGNVSLLWIDAHADLNTNLTSNSGNVHGMPLALLAAELSDYWPYMPGMDWQRPVLPLRHVAYVGLRSVDAYERLAIDRLGVAAYGLEHVDDVGVRRVVELALERIDPGRDRSLHISFDVDALDAVEAPSTGTPVRGGLTLREAIRIVEVVRETGRLAAFDIVEVNPLIGDKKDVDKTVGAALHVAMAACGHCRRGVRPWGIDSLPLQTFPPTRQEI